MSILINKSTQVLVQGITGEEGRKATKLMLEYGTNIICGVTPGKEGQEIEGLPVFNNISDALISYPNINTSILYVPPLRAKNAAFEAIENGIKLILCITENIPIHDIAQIISKCKEKNIKFIGPSSLGIITPNEAKIGSIGGKDNSSYVKGNIGLISKSGGMCSETALLLKNNGYGITTAVAIGGDFLLGYDFVDCLKEFEKDNETKLIVVYGEIGGEYENLIAQAILNKEITKPVVAYISGKFATMFPSISLGHAGAIVEGENSTREAKIKILEKAGVGIAQIHHEIIDEIKKIM